ncbi:hypothetical protein AURDEDRAFT_163518 [Auricularia subglabra TFB-10046 SS5]|nr:hypothetical protein AURDEDRAFT_163518 [Auricularia subglabra TFB-10046 SS5]
MYRPGKRQLAQTYLFDTKKYALKLGFHESSQSSRKPVESRRSRSRLHQSLAVTEVKSSRRE